MHGKSTIIYFCTSFFKIESFEENIQHNNLTNINQQNIVFQDQSTNLNIQQMNLRFIDLELNKIVYQLNKAILNGSGTNLTIKNSKYKFETSQYSIIDLNLTDINISINTGIKGIKQIADVPIPVQNPLTGMLDTNINLQSLN